MIMTSYYDMINNNNNNRIDLDLGLLAANRRENSALCFLHFRQIDPSTG